MIEVAHELITERRPEWSVDDWHCTCGYWGNLGRMGYLAHIAEDGGPEVLREHAPKIGRSITGAIIDEERVMTSAELVVAASKGMTNDEREALEQLARPRSLAVLAERLGLSGTTTEIVALCTAVDALIVRGYAELDPSEGFSTFRYRLTDTGRRVLR